MITNLNYIIDLGNPLVYYYNDSISQSTQTFDNQVLYRAFRLDFFENYYKQLATVNGVENLYILNLQSINSIQYTSGNSYLNIIYKNKDSLLIELLDVDSARDNYEYLMSCLKAYNIQDYLLTKNKLYVCLDATEDSANNIYTDIQTAIDNWTSSDIVYVQSGTYNLGTLSLEFTGSVEMYCEDVEIISSGNAINYLSLLPNQYINIYGNATITGGVYLFDNNSQTTELEGLNFFLECYSLKGTVYKNSCGKTRIRAYSKLYNIGNSFDTDALNDVLDVDILHITRPQSYLYHPLTAHLSRVYFRNCNMEGVMNIDSGASGVYNINYIGCNFNLSKITFSDSNDSTVNIWSSYFVTSEDYFIAVTNGDSININFYGKNYSNKSYESNAVIGGTGVLNIDIDLDLLT
jgi:hypothetical protein